MIVVSWFTALQGLVPSGQLGRVVSVGRALGYSAIPCGAVLGGWLVGRGGNGRALFAGAAALQVIVFAAAAASPLARYGRSPAGRPAPPQPVPG